MDVLTIIENFYRDRLYLYPILKDINKDKHKVDPKGYNIKRQLKSQTFFTAKNNPKSHRTFIQ